MIARITLFILFAWFIYILSSFTQKLTKKIEEKEHEKNMAALTDSLGALVLALEKKDQYTNGHAKRTYQYAKAIADNISLPLIDEYKFSTGCLLHDIGKIGIPDAILMKSGPLTNEEFVQIKQHSEMGSDILLTTQSLQDAIPMILYHHEKYDGTGYPKGLKGEEIPLESRILAVADTFDAMTSNRSYRSALSPEQAYEEIVHKAGTQFCPLVVEAFIKTYFGSNNELFTKPHYLEGNSL